MSLDAFVTELTIDPFPQDVANGRHWRIQVQRTATGEWILHNVGYWLQPDRTWYPDRSSATRLVGAEDAADLTRQVLPGIEVNGHTWADMCAKWGTP